MCIHRTNDNFSFSFDFVKARREEIYSRWKTDKEKDFNNLVFGGESLTGIYSPNVLLIFICVYKWNFIALRNKTESCQRIIKTLKTHFHRKSYEQSVKVKENFRRPAYYKNQVNISRLFQPTVHMLCIDDRMILMKIRKNFDYNYLNLSNVTWRLNS